MSRSDRPGACKRPMWGSFFLMLMSIVVYSAAVLMVSPRNATLVPLLVGVVFPCGGCLHCARSSTAMMIGLYTEETGEWEWVEPWGYQGREPDAEVYFREFDSPMGLWVRCASSQWASIQVRDLTAGANGAAPKALDERAAEELLRLCEGMETDQYGRSLGAVVEVASTGGRSGSRGMVLSTTGTLSGQSTIEYSLLGIAHDVVMSMVAGVCGWMGVVSVRRMPAWRRERAWRAKSCCGSCGYDLTGLHDRVCPECGRDNGAGGAAAAD